MIDVATYTADRYAFDMSKYILNISELEYKPFPAPMPDRVKDTFEGATLGWVGPRVGAQKLGYNVTVLPPGKRAFPIP